MNLAMNELRQSAAVSSGWGINAAICDTQRPRAVSAASSAKPLQHHAGPRPREYSF